MQTSSFRSLVNKSLFPDSQDSGSFFVIFPKIKDIFIDEKIDILERDLYPIVVDAQENIVWLPGLKKSKFNKSKEEKCDIILRYY